MFHKSKDRKMRFTGRSHVRSSLTRWDLYTSIKRSVVHWIHTWTDTVEKSSPQTAIWWFNSHIVGASCWGRNCHLRTIVRSRKCKLEIRDLHLHTLGVSCTRWSSNIDQTWYQLVYITLSVGYHRTITHLCDSFMQLGILFFCRCIFIWYGLRT